MPAHAIIGAQWGDEGKGKLVDYLAPRYDYVARFQGGNNAGHTVKVGDITYKFHLLPSGAVQGRPVVVGNGTVVDPRVLLEEMGKLSATGKKLRLFLSDRAHVIMPYHVAIDAASESGAGPKIGTTKRGIGPCYADKAARLGIRVHDLIDETRLRKRLQTVLPSKKREMEAMGVPAPSLDLVLKEYAPLGQRLRPFAADTGELLGAALSKGKTVLFEGAQGVLLDIDHGTYPYVTSSNTTAGNATTGSGVGPGNLGAVFGVAKAYVTRVGEGPFPTELDTTQGVGKTLLTVGKEFGTTTGRPRRCGWLDLPALRYAARVSGLTHLAITKLDVLDGVEEIRVCTAYRLDGKKISRFPADLEDLARVQPVWKTLSGWDNAGQGEGKRRKLSPQCEAYIRFIENESGVPVPIASVGPARHETVVRRKNPFMAA